MFRVNQSDGERVAWTSPATVDRKLSSGFHNKWVLITSSSLAQAARCSWVQYTPSSTRLAAELNVKPVDVWKGTFRDEYIPARLNVQLHAFMFEAVARSSTRSHALRACVRHALSEFPTPLSMNPVPTESKALVEHPHTLHKYALQVAFNQAFKDKGLPHEWGVEKYGELLKIGGGKERMDAYFSECADQEPYKSITDPQERKEFLKELHLIKTRLFQKMILAGQMPLRPGVKELVGALLPLHRVQAVHAWEPASSHACTQFHAHAWELAGSHACTQFHAHAWELAGSHACTQFLSMQHTSM
jgi:hypothetical protein